ncbi:MAG TPA: cbb3-type cytochrome c oxidase subunit I [Noviherbaspirillum sp.]|nr:cbb3-type cytochrome c oxidase subunit I [Noviherbaspirillum sp.]
MLRESHAVRRLAAGWLLLALLALGLSTACALLLVAARAPLPGGAIAPAALFRSTLVLHVGLAVVVWFLSGAAALWTLAAGGAAGLARRGALALAGGGVLAMVAAPFAGPAAPVLANYVPVLDSPVFLLGLGCFFAGIALCGLTSLRPLAARLRQPEPKTWRVAAAWSLPAAALALGMLAFFLVRDGLPHAAAGYEVLAWGPGHVLQFVHILLLMGAWTVLGERALGGSVAPRRLLLAMLALAALPLVAVPAIVAAFPIESAAFRHAFTALMAWSSWPAPLALGVLLLARLARAGRDAWRTPAALPLALSILLFMLGCALGASIRGESTMVPAHYHGTVGAVTLAYMALGYQLLAEFGRRPPHARRVRWQPAIYGVGLMVLASALAWSGSLGVPRKTPHADIIVHVILDNPAYFTAMGLAGLGGCLAVGGAALFVFNVAGALGGVRRARGAALPRRLRWAALSALGVLLASGLLTACLPGNDAAAPANDAPMRHAAQKRKEEVDRMFSDAVVLLNARQYQSAVDALHRVLELAPRMPEAHVNMGFALIGLQRYEAARDSFQVAIDLRSTQLNAYYGLAEALEGLHDLAGALGAMRTYVHLSKPDDPFLAKANSAIWEWEAELQKIRGNPPADSSQPPQVALPENGKNGIAYPIREKRFD